MFVGMVLQTINPAITNAITELFLLPVKNVLKPKAKKRKSQFLYIKMIAISSAYDYKIPNLWQIWSFIIIESIAQYPFLYPAKIRSNLDFIEDNIIFITCKKTKA